MGVCGSKPPAVKQDLAIPAQNGTFESAPQPAKPMQQSQTNPADAAPTSIDHHQTGAPVKAEVRVQLPIHK